MRPKMHGGEGKGKPSAGASKIHAKPICGKCGSAGHLARTCAGTSYGTFRPASGNPGGKDRPKSKGSRDYPGMEAYLRSVKDGDGPKISSEGPTRTMWEGLHKFLAAGWRPFRAPHSEGEEAPKPGHDAGGVPASDHAPNQRESTADRVPGGLTGSSEAPGRYTARGKRGNPKTAPDVGWNFEAQHGLDTCLSGSEEEAKVVDRLARNSRKVTFETGEGPAGRDLDGQPGVAGSGDRRSRGRPSNLHWSTLMGVHADLDTGAHVVGRTNPWGHRGWFAALFSEDAKLVGTQRVRLESTVLNEESDRLDLADWFGEIVPTYRTSLFAKPGIVSLRLLAKLVVFMANRPRTSSTPLLLRTKAAQYAKELGLSSEQLAVVIHSSISLAMLSTGAERGAWSWFGGRAARTMLRWSEDVRAGVLERASWWRVYAVRGLFWGSMLGLVFSPVGGFLWGLFWQVLGTTLGRVTGIVLGWIFILCLLLLWAETSTRGSRLSSPA